MNKQIVDSMSSPFTGGAVYLVEDTEVQTFRKEKYSVHVRYYVCKDTGEQFTSEEQDEQLCNELYNQYRIRHGIPFPDEIRKIREHYGLSHSQITKIVGFGQNQWSQYENGNLPSESNGKSIAAIRSREGMLSMLESSRNQFDESTFSRIKKNIMCVSDIDSNDAPYFYFYGNSKRGVNNGYSEMNPDKLQCMVQLIVSKEKMVCLRQSSIKKCIMQISIVIRNMGVPSVGWHIVQSNMDLYLNIMRLYMIMCKV